jgi:hypothetical protein
MRFTIDRADLTNSEPIEGAEYTDSSNATIEFATIEDLMAYVEKHGPVILSGRDEHIRPEMPHIEIYDYYVE